jgi:hypothetical protein
MTSLSHSISGIQIKHCVTNLKLLCLKVECFCMFSYLTLFCARVFVGMPGLAKYLLC